MGATGAIYFKSFSSIVCFFMSDLVARFLATPVKVLGVRSFLADDGFLIFFKDPKVSF